MIASCFKSLNIEVNRLRRFFAYCVGILVILDNLNEIDYLLTILSDAGDLNSSVKIKLPR